MIVPRLVLDTNVVVSGLLGSDGPPARVLDLVREAQIRLLLDDRIRDEYAVVLSRPKFRRAIDASDVELLLSLLSRFGERIAAPPLTVCLRDPDDGPFLEVAAAGGAAERHRTDATSVAQEQVPLHLPGVDLVVLCGLQGSGKSTFFGARFAASHAHVSQDRFPSARDPAARRRALVEEAARAGRSAVVDDTNVTRERRAALVALARELGMRPVLYWFPPDVRGSLARNAGRTGRARVPNVAIFAARKRLAAPEASEGFAAAFEVVPTPEGGFVVAPRPDLAG